MLHETLQAWINSYYFLVFYFVQKIRQALNIEISDIYEPQADIVTASLSTCNWTLQLSNQS